MTRGRLYRAGSAAPLAALALLAGVGLLACGSSPAAVDRPPRRTVLAVEAAPAGLEAAVRLDSCRWQPYALLADGAEWEIEGNYFLRFRNLAERPLELRHELRFLDAEEFLLDVFIPFGQPVRVEALGTRDSAGVFRIRVRGEPEDVQPVILQVAVRLALPP